VHKQSKLWPDWIESDLQCEPKEVTFYLQSLVTNSDRILLSAELDIGPRLKLVVGLRSSILESFERFVDFDVSSHMPCDIPGFVTGLSLLTSGKKLGIVDGAVSDCGPGRITLIFESETMGELSRKVCSAILKWNSWLEIMLDALNHEPIDGEWSFEWPEYLAGESGYVTMDWYQSIPDEARYVALNHLIGVSTSVLRSLLSTRQYSRKVVREFIEWLESLEPLPYIVGYQRNLEIQEVMI